MLHPQVVVHESDGQLAEQLRPFAAARRWALREPRQADVLWRILEAGGPTVLIVMLDRKQPERQLALIERVSWRLPDVAIIAAGSPDDAENLAGLCWDVGANYTLFPPQSRDRFSEVVAGLMRRAISDLAPGAAIRTESQP